MVVTPPFLLKTKQTMLYKNDEPYKLGQPDIDAVKKYFHNKFPVKVVYPASRIIKSRLPHNRLPDQPNSMSFDLKAVVKSAEKGTEIWRYADDVMIDKNGRKRYTPKKFRFNGARFLEERDIELIFFLLRKSEHRLIGDDELKKDAKLRQSSSPKFMFEDLVTEAEKKADAKALESRISVLLYNKELGLPEAKIRLVAKAYGIKGVDSLTAPQVKILLDNKIHDKKLGGPDKFFDMVDANSELEARSSIQSLEDMKLIHYDLGKKVWFWNATGEQGRTQIAKVSRADVPMEVLFDMYNGDQAFREEVDALLLSKGKKAKKEKKDEEEE